jgi:hypothetical protein
MPAARSSRVCPIVDLTIAAIGLIGTCGNAIAQSIADATSGATASSSAPVPTLQSLDQSQRTQDFTAVQLRRFVDERGNIVSVREQLQVASNGTARPTFAVTFLGVEGEPVGSALSLHWQQVYAAHGAQFYLHGSFRIRDLGRAAANYTIHDFGLVLRTNRSARRMVVFPGSADKAIWVVDVDTQTGIPLYTAEFDPQLRLLSEVEALTFTNSVAAIPTITGSATQVASFSSARSIMGDPAEIVDPNVAPVASEYQLERVEVESSPLNGQWKMTMTYTDGVDQFLVVEVPKTPDWLATLPARANGGHVIGRFRDPAMSLLVFWEGGVLFHVAGRGSLTRLDELARALYLQAIASH